MHCNAEFYYVGKIPRTGIGHGISRPPQQRRVALRRRNTVVGGKCALPSALLVELDLLLSAVYLIKNCLDSSLNSQLKVRSSFELDVQMMDRFADCKFRFHLLLLSLFLTSEIFECT